MPKLKKFKNQNEKKVSTKNLFIAFGIILMIMGGVIISKSYAIYKLEKKYDIIQSKIGSYSMGDVRVAVIVDGKEASQFPNYETNYKVEKVECTNGVNANFDVKNWQINIADMSATSTKCTVYFNSKETNEETPIAYTKEELLAINEEIKNTTTLQLADKLYPVGSIYMSTTDDSVEKVKERFGGTWVKYAEDMTIVGASSSKNVNSTGGNENVSAINIQHTHTYDKTTSGSYSTVISHNHLSPTANANINGEWYTGYTMQFGFKASTRASYSFWGAKMDIDTEHVPSSSTVDLFNTSTVGSKSGDVTLKHTATNTGDMSTNSSINAQDPYIAVYMYKRTA